MIKKLPLFLLFFLFTPTTSASPELKILRITPAGENAPPGQQIVIEFDQPVVSLGNMQRDQQTLPITIEPATDCQWRWADTRSLMCQLDAHNKLKLATRYTVTVSPGIHTEKGSILKSVYRHIFTTERPEIRSVWFRTWFTPGTPVIYAEFDMPIKKESVDAHVFLEADGERYALKAEPDPENKSIEPEYQQIWVLTPQKELPLDTPVSLKIEPGLVTNEGPLIGNEQRVVDTFHTFPEFSFLGVKCYSYKKKEMVTLSESSIRPTCDPQSTVYLSFSSPVPLQQIKEQLDMEPDLAGGRKDYDPWAGQTFHSRLNDTHYKDQTYDIFFPEFLKAWQQYELHSKKLLDEFGRELNTPVNLRFMTDHRQPGMVLNPFSVLEKRIDSQIPVYVTNLDKLDLDYSKMIVGSFESGLHSTVALPQVTDIAFAHPLPIRKLLQGRSGVISGELQMDPNPEGHHPYQIFSQVTPFQVHIKLGNFKSLIWVLDMATGEPVPNARVTIYTSKLSSPLLMKENILETVTTNASGLAEFSGRDRLDPDFEYIHKWGFDDNRLLVQVEKDQDMALLPISGAFTVWGRDVYPQDRDQYGFIKVWGTTAQGVYKPGDTVQYKFYIRGQNNKTLINPPNLKWKLIIRDPGNKVIDEIDDLKLNAFGAFDGEIFIPKNTAVGNYRFELSASDPADKTRSVFQSVPFNVLISDFTPAPFKVMTELNGKNFTPGKELAVTTSARLHAGGPYTRAQTRVSAELIGHTFSPKHPVAKNFKFDTYLPDSPRSEVLFNKQGMLDDHGDLETRVELQDKNIIYGTLRVESRVQDDRGKNVANLATAQFFSRDRLVGLKNTQWIYRQNEEANIQYLVVDQEGQPVADSLVKLRIEREETKASRVKSAGNTYVTKYLTDWIEVAKCEGRSAVEASDCVFTPEKPGSYRITAIIQDTKGREHSSRIYAWVAGKGQVLWEQPENNNLSIIQENTEPKIGDTVRYLVKNPYPGGKALITVERYGILKSWVEDFPDSTEIIEFEVEPDFMPGYYLSITVFSPRVDKPVSMKNVDLGKPAFSMGYVQVPVSDPWKQVELTINSTQETYKPGEIVELSFSARPANGSHHEPIELAIIVLDEAVFDLITQGKSYFDPYQGFYSLDSLDVTNYSLLTRLIGRQKFETKGANAGGDGGASGINFRSVKNYVGYWNPSLVIQPGDTESVSFRAPDNLTGWIVLAIAVTKGDRFGLGTSGFKVNQAIELRPVMPNQIIQGDEFKAGFSVMNRTETARNVEVEIKATGSVEQETRINKKITVEPFKRETVWLPIKSNKPGSIHMTVTARSGEDNDALTHTVPVLKRRVLDTTADYGSLTQTTTETSIHFPEKIYTDTGGLTVTVSPTVIGHLDGAFRYIRDYPYWCWEQRLTKGVTADHFNQMQNYLPDDLDWQESRLLPDKILKDTANFQAPNGGMAFWVPQDEYVSPYLSAYTALAFDWLKKTGHTIPIQVEKNLHNYLANLLKHDVTPSFYDKGMASTVRAVALAALAKESRITLDDLERYREHVPRMSLFGKAHYLIAANHVAGADEIVSTVSRQILDQGVQSAGKLQFNETLNTGSARILETPLRTQCAILSAFTQTAHSSQGKKLIGDAPLKLVRAITQGRGARDHWENTQENMFCINALREYSTIYEAEKPAMTVQASLGDQLLGSTHFDDKRDPAVEFLYPFDTRDSGRKTRLKIEKQGDGRLYYSTRLQYALPEGEVDRVNAGIEIHREYSIKRKDKWEILRSPMQIKRGDLVRVELFVHLPAARNFVVIDDPVPGGLEPVNRDLATASIMDTEQSEFKAADGSYWFQRNDWEEFRSSRWSFYHRELRHDSVRFYSDYLNRGDYHLSYTAQAIATGTFSVPPAKAEEMYDPDIYGHSLPATLNVIEQ